MTLVEELLDAFGAPSASERRLREYGLAAFCGDDVAARQVQLAQVLLRGALREIVGAFGDEVPFLLLKGEPLQALLFENKYLRSTGDIDLLVLPGDLGIARRRLAALGYRRKSDEGPRMWVHYQEAWRHEKLGVIVEIHWSVAEPQMAQPALYQLMDTRVGFRFDDGLEVDVLRSDWLFFQLVLHFHHHIGFAKGLLDIAGWLDRFGADVDRGEMLARARRLRMFGMVQWPLHTIARLVGRPPPMWDGGADLFVRVCTAASASAMRDCLARPPRNDVEASLSAVMLRVGPAMSVTMQALRMLTADGGKVDKGRAFLRPVLEGPHFVGRALRRR